MISITTIEQQVAEVVAYSQNFTPNVTELIESWAEAKSFFLDAWGAPVIECGPVTFSLSPEEKRTRMSEFLDSIDSTYGEPGYRLTRFISDNEDNFFSNRLEKDYEFNGTVIPKGMKIVKAFKYFLNGRALEEVQNQASMIIQEDKVTGTLCLSVHPLDFLSASENTYQWRSCHALDGDYRAGNLSYMMDSCTIMCYLRGADNVKLPRFPESVPWNNKKWRMWLYISEDQRSMFAGRQYPFFSPNALNAVREAIVPYLETNSYHRSHWSNWHNDYITEFPRCNEIYSYHEQNLRGRHISIGRDIQCMKDIVHDRSSLHFNDLIQSSFYIPYYSWNLRYQKHEPRFNIGGPVRCLCCGGDFIEQPETMLCDKCQSQQDDSEYRYCGCCDRQIHIGDMIWVEGAGNYLCEECVQRYTTRCEHCGELYYTNNCKYDAEKEIYLCENCANPRTPEEIRRILNGSWNIGES